MQELVAYLAAAVVFLIFCCILSCCIPEGDRGHNRPQRASSSDKAHAPYTRGSNVRTKKSTVKTPGPTIPEHSRNLSRLNRISPPPHAEQSSVKALSNILLSDEGKNITAEDIRKIARGLQRERQEGLRRANQARKRGDYDAEARYKQDIQECKRGVEFMNKVAAEVIFTKKNKVSHDLITSEIRCPRPRPGILKPSFFLWC